uniref:Cytochrome c-553 n=1 Tax=Spermothamnion repens TaxID=31383 RepID=A0A4D6WYS4_9FLOR|nr:cytochrome c553 [Spermothamnion repens]
MKFVIRLIYLFIFVSIFQVNLVLAEEISAGEMVFNANCAACHANGQNSVSPEKTLEKEILEKNSMYSVDAIINQVTGGKNAMPPFGERLSSDDIINVANFVLNKSDSW